MRLIEWREVEMWFLGVNSWPLKAANSPIFTIFALVIGKH